MDQTTDELLAHLKGKPMAHGGFDRLQTILSACDTVKFARFEPGQRKLDELNESARTFLDLTRPVATTGARSEAMRRSV